MQSVQPMQRLSSTRATDGRIIRGILVSDLPCCEQSSWVLELDLDEAGGFDYALGKCARCGTPWLSVFCVASSISGYEPVNPADLGQMRSLPAGPKRKAFMRKWGDDNL